MEPGQDYGIKWLVEERDRLKARCEVLENELVRRDEAETRHPPQDEQFFIQVDPLSVPVELYRGDMERIADLLVKDLSKEILNRSLHKISKMKDGSLRLWCVVRTQRPWE